MTQSNARARREARQRGGQPPSPFTGFDLGIDRVLLYNPGVLKMFGLFLPAFFTFWRFFLAFEQQSNRPFMPFLDFVYPVIPGAPMPWGRWLFFMAIVLVFMAGSYRRLPRNLIENFQRANVTTVVAFWYSWFAFLGLFWIQFPFGP